MTSTKPNPDVLYQALLKRDTGYEGITLVGVKTTGIFCRLSCHARKPKRENVEFFESAREAVLHGYRPCKLCDPLGFRGSIPEWLQPLLENIENNPGLKLKNSDLRQGGFEPSRVRRWFKKHHGLTFQGYLRALRVGRAFDRVQKGTSVISAAFDSGYDSLSGFNDAFKKATGFSPINSHSRTIITISRILTPLGPMFAGATDQGVCLFEFMDRRMLETQINQLKKKLNAEMVPGSNSHLNDLTLQIAQYFSGDRQVFDLPLVLIGTPFQKKVWTSLQSIPYGETRSYGDQARMIGNVKAVRAVGRANGENRIAIILPCHRVVGKDGQLVGYGGSLWRKKSLLDLENKNLLNKK